jgi:hypothetical protein
MGRRSRATVPVRQPRRGTIVAAARRATVGQPAAVVKDVIRRAETWQKEAWSYFDETPEVKFAVRWTGDAFAKLRLQIGVVDPLDPSAEPMAPRDADGKVVAGVDARVLAIAEAELARLRSPIGGQPEILRVLNMNLEVAGEAYIVGEPERIEAVPGPLGVNVTRTIPEAWGVYSTDEISEQDGRVQIQDAPSSTPRLMEEGTVAIRLYQRHPRYSALPDSWVRGVLRECQALDTLTKLIIADANSRRSNGILFLSNELTLVTSDDPTDGPVDEDDAGETSLIMAALDMAYSDAIADPESPAAVAPILMRGPTDAIKDGVRHEQLSRSQDSTLDERIEKRVLRLARGANVPVEVVEGHAATTFANAEQIDQDAFEDHLEPRCVMVVDALTSAFLHPNMIDLRGVAPEQAMRFVVWYDPSALIAQPDVQAAADAGLDKLAISAEAWRRVRGFDEGDAPTEEEMIQRVALTRASIDQVGLGAILTATGFVDIELPDPAGFGEATGAPELGPAPAPPTTPEEAPPAPVEPAVASARPITAARRRPTGERLAAIDRDLRTRLLVAANVAMARALERAGNRAKTKAPAEVRAALSASGADACDVIRLIGRAGLAAALRGGDAEDLLDGAWDALGEQYLTWGAKAQEAALAVVEDAVNGLARSDRAALRARQADDLAAGWEWFRASLTRIAVDRMFDPGVSAAASARSLGEFDESLRVPVGMIRGAMARAGGTTGLATSSAGGMWVTLTEGGSRPAGGIATGGLLDRAMTDHGVVTEGYVWVYGAAPRRSFQPHLDLDGQEFVNFDDPVLLNPEGWPATYCLPGDHDGCLCDFSPVLIDAGLAPPPDEPDAGTLPADAVAYGVSPDSPLGRALAGSASDAVRVISDTPFQRGFIGGQSQQSQAWARSNLEHLGSTVPEAHLQRVFGQGTKLELVQGSLADSPSLGLKGLKTTDGRDWAGVAGVFSARERTFAVAELPMEGGTAAWAENVVVHEFGHALDRSWNGQGGSLNDWYSDSPLFAHLHRTYYDQFGPPGTDMMGDYYSGRAHDLGPGSSLLDQDRAGRKEMFAEGYNAWALGPGPDRDAKLNRILGFSTPREAKDVLMDYFDKFDPETAGEAYPDY